MQMIELLANIDVDDLERAVEFYTRGLGLKVGRRLEAFAAVELVGACSRIYLLAKAAGTVPGAGLQNETQLPASLDARPLGFRR